MTLTKPRLALLTTAVAVGVLAIFAAARWPEWALAVAAIGILGAVLAFGFAAQLQARRARRSVAALRKEVAGYHKRASSWDWKLNQRLDRLEKSTRAPGTAAAGGRRHDWQNNAHAPALLSTRAFSAGFYRAQTGHQFATARDAAAHYLTHSMPHLLAPNAFVDPDAFPEPVKKAMRDGEPLPFIDQLRSSSNTFGAAFDPAFAPQPEIRDGSVGPLGAFLASLDEQSPMPVPITSHLAGIGALDYAVAITETSRSIDAERKLKAPRATSRWYAAAEEAWKADTRTVDLGEAAPRVSIVMPVWNRVDYVGAAIESIQQQTYADWRLYVIDDHSTDGTLELLHALAAQDDRITVLMNANKGVSSARNTGIDAAEDGPLAFLDSDNTWRPDFLELMVKAMHRDELRLSYAASRVSYGSEKPAKYLAYRGGREHLRFLNHVDMNVLMTDRALAKEVGGFDEALKRWVDHDFALRLSRCAEPVLQPFIGCEYEHSMDRSDRITVREHDHWQWVVLGKAMVDWDAEATKKRVPGRLSVVIPTFNDHEMTLRAVRSVLADHDLEDLEVLVVDNGSAKPHALAMVRALTHLPRVRYLRLLKNYNFAIGCNYGFAESTGENVFFLNNDTYLRRGTLRDLVRGLGDDSVLGVQPLLVYDDDTIQTAGTVWVAPESLPVHLLAGHPLEDARGAAPAELRAISAAAALVRASDFAAVRGFDPFYVNGMEDVDFCLRLLAHRPGRFRLDPDVVVTHLESKTPGRGKALHANRQIFMDRWRGALPAAQPELFAQCGFEIARVGSDGSRGAVLGSRVTLTRRTPARRRWAIKNPANATIQGDGWGDTHFAASLGSALERLGQEVVTYRHEGHNAEATAFDDVSLVLRGLDRIRPIPGQLNVLWVISHPERVSLEEVQGFDLIFAASATWAEQMTHELGVRIEPLLQATDSSRFFPVADAPAPTRDAIFVGGSYRKRERRVVLQAIESGVDFSVIGPDWTGIVPEPILAGQYIANAQLADTYRSARFVLADHWPQMADAGFIQNRIFDAVASGCRVLTDPVAGLSTVFGPEVLEVRDAADIAEAVAGAKQKQPDLDALREAAERVVAEHSFDARARRLIDDVAKL